jgi:hypothetical protein
MARDNSPKARQQKDLQRKQGQRASHDRILIVTEGSKTEPLYFQEIRAAYRLNTASVEVRHSAHGPAPIQVVEYAHELFLQGNRHNRIQPKAFEQVYAVFDRDEHPSYAAALQQAAALDGKLKNDAGQRVTFKVIASVPSFELWLLLHYENIQAPIHRDDVIRHLRRYMPGYEKGAGRAFSTTRAHLQTALQRAEKLAERFNAHTDPEPYTGIATLVKTLTELNA